MNTTTVTEPAGKRMRNSSVVLTDRMCQKRVARRVKIYDRKCPGLYVSITTAGVATFSFKFTDPATGKQRTGWLGVYNPETFAVEHARSRVLRPQRHGCGGEESSLKRTSPICFHASWTAICCRGTARERERCVEGSSLLVPEDHPDARSRMMLT